eukprot:c41780_g1_i1.p1 GENE.c41780_g1_i1~~c41780_g1_i1.p1  ORF type:complete len:134 (+),score=7.46 c41780_g1_i1:62-463(+)
MESVAPTEPDRSAPGMTTPTTAPPSKPVHQISACSERSEDPPADPPPPTPLFTSLSDCKTVSDGSFRSWASETRQFHLGARQGTFSIGPFSEWEEDHADSKSATSEDSPSEPAEDSPFDSHTRKFKPTRPPPR